MSSSSSSVPASWPSVEARRAGYGSSPREPALNVPAEVLGRLPPWLKGQYVRNGPGELSEMEVRLGGAWWAAGPTPPPLAWALHGPAAWLMGPKRRRPLTHPPAASPHLCPPAHV